MPTRHRRLAIALPTLLVVLLVACRPGTLGDAPTRLDIGHVDVFNVVVEDDTIDLVVKDDANPPTAINRDPRTVLLQALPASEVSVPPVPAFAFLGDPGDLIWLLPQVQNPSLLWPGWSAEQVAQGALLGNTMTITVMGVQGPGSFHLFQNDPFGAPIVLMTSNNAFPQSLSVSTGAHVHANWAFGAEGLYTMLVKVSAQLPDGTPTESGPVPFRWVVGDHECADVVDLTTSNPVAASGGSIDVDYTIANCGSVTVDPGVDLWAYPTDECSEPAVRTEVSPTSLSVGGDASGSVSVDLPDCEGDTELRGVPVGADHRFASELSITLLD